MFEDEHAQQHFHWRGVPPMHQGILIPLAEVGPYLQVERIIVEQSIQLAQHWIDLVG